MARSLSHGQVKALFGLKAGCIMPIGTLYGLERESGHSWYT